MKGIGGQPLKDLRQVLEWAQRRLCVVPAVGHMSRGDSGVADTFPKATYLARLLAVSQDDPTPERVRALLDRAQAAGVKQNGLYLSAMRLHPRDLPLPPDPRLVLKAPTDPEA